MLDVYYYNIGILYRLSTEIPEKRLLLMHITVYSRKVDCSLRAFG